MLYIFHMRRDPQDTLYQLTIAHPQQKDIVVSWQINELCSLFHIRHYFNSIYFVQ